MANSLRVVSLGIVVLALAACGQRNATQQASNTPPPAQPAQAAPPPPPPPPAPPNPNEQLTNSLDALGAQQSDRGLLVRLSSAQFEPGQTQFQPSDSERIDKIVSLLEAHPETQVKIEGYTDSRGSQSVNQKISKERADAVRKLLVSRGIDESRLTVKGMGEANPVADNSTEQGRQENRRVELLFSDAQGRFASAGNPAPTG